MATVASHLKHIRQNVYYMCELQIIVPLELMGFGHFDRVCINYVHAHL